eukprot:IDg8364t1
MRITDFRVGRARARVGVLLRRLRLACAYATMEHQLRLLNTYSDEQCLIHFRFRRCELPRLCTLIGWNSGRTERNGYKNMGKLVTTFRKDLVQERAPVFRMHLQKGRRVETVASASLTELRSELRDLVGTIRCNGHATVAISVCTVLVY